MQLFWRSREANQKMLIYYEQYTVFYMLSQSLKLCEFLSLRILTIECDWRKKKITRRFWNTCFGSPVISDRLLMCLKWGSLSCRHSIWTSIREYMCEIFNIWIGILTHTEYHFAVSFTLISDDEKWGSPWCCINFLYTSFPSDMSVYSILVWQ